MQRETRAIKPLVPDSLVFVTLGVTLATDTLSRFGLEGNYAIVFSLALVIAALILSKNLVMLLVVLAGFVLSNLPDATLLNLGLGRDMLLAGVCVCSYVFCCAKSACKLLIRLVAEPELQICSVNVDR